MDIYVINLDRSTERLQEFRQTNAHMPEIKRFSAVDGSTIDRRQLVDVNVISGELPNTNGAIGSAPLARFAIPSLRQERGSFWRAACRFAR